MKTKKVLLTGATGYVGRHLLKSLVKNGHDVHIIIRDSKKNSSLSQNGVTVYEGDISKVNFGLNAKQIAQLTGRIDCLIHSAGITRFNDAHAEEFSTHNELGSQNAFLLCKKLNINALHHLSTAFVSGNLASPLSEHELDRGQVFRNKYEESKFNAERILKDASIDDAVRVIRYRPSIIVGGDAIGDRNQISTVYAYLKSLLFMEASMQRDWSKDRKFAQKYRIVKIGLLGWEAPLRFAADPAIKLNLVHINRVVDIITERIGRDHNQSGVQDIIGSNDFSLDEIKTAFCGTLGMRGMRLVSKEEFDQNPRNRLEEKFFRATKVFEPYLFSQSHFKTPLNEEARYQVSLEEIAHEFIRDYRIRFEISDRQKLSHIALDVLNIHDSQGYLDHFSEGDLGESFMKRICYLKAIVGFRVKGHKIKERVLIFDHGKVLDTQTKLYSNVQADCTYEMDEDVFNLIVKGDLDPREALFKGRLKIQGDQVMGLKLGAVFIEYFAHLEDRVLEELV